MREEYGWKLYKGSNIKIWFFGYQYNSNIEDLFSEASSILCDHSVDKHSVLDWIKKISGHFSVVLETNKWVVAAVDKICTNPIFFVEKEDGVFISNYAPILKRECNLEVSDFNTSSGLELSMSGHTIGKKTLYHSLNRLEGGECILYHQGTIFKEFYYTYSPWKTKDRSKCKLKKEFTDICINTLTDLKSSINGRQVVIPLSAGNDSRLIASGLKELGVKNIVCFSYGRKGNFETPVSKAVAEKLGYQWLYLPTNLRDKHRFFKSDLYHKYVSDFESYGSIPNTQEIYEVSLLNKHPLIDSEAIIVNGNSGDFISGGHISSISDLEYTMKSTSKSIWKFFLDKHYSLWGDLRTTANDDYIVSELEKILSLRITESVDVEKYHYAMMECIECIGRQSRIVSNQQRTYEFFGYDWRLPLWSDDMLNFWESVPYEYKINQRLYIETLHENNWGDVWLDIKANDKKINPYYLRWIRLLFKILFIPAGELKWHRFEKNFFEYFMHPSNALTVESYFKILFDRREYRNANSWLSHKMIEDIRFNSDLQKEK